MLQSSRRFPLLQVALFGGAIATTAVSLLGPAWCRSVGVTLHDNPKAVIDEVWQLVNSEYVDPTFNSVNWQATRQSLLSKDYTSREQAYTAIQKTLEKLGDPYTRFLDPKEYEALANQTSGELSGIGIRMELNEKTKRLTVVEVIENSPASKAGIKVGDQILAIDGKPLQGLDVRNASQLIRGKLGTQVTLQMRRQEQSNFELKLTRIIIELPSVLHTFKQEGNRRIGYVRLQEFSAHAAEQMQRAIRKLNHHQVDAFVLDLRSNPGGLLQSSVEIARMWLNTGSIVRTVDRLGGREELAANKTALTKQPMIVLVDGNSASASEILAGALQDNHRAVVVGSQTFGKALVQSVHSLSDGSGLAITVAHYYTPKGTDISHKGITPNIKMDLTDEQKRFLAANPELLGTQADPQYARAVTALTTKPFAWSPQN